MVNFEPIFLIAVPQMGDPNFEKAIVLMLQHDGEGGIGLVLNHPSQITLSRFGDSQGLLCHQNLASDFVYTGGPVQPERGWILHTDPNIEEKQVLMPGLYVSGTKESLKILLEEGKSPVRLVLGYSGWSAGQLEEEMIQGAWITSKADSRYVFDDSPKTVWNTILNDMGVDPNRLMVGHGLH